MNLSRLLGKLCVCIFPLVSFSANASLIGDTVTCVGLDSFIGCNPTSATVSSGVEFGIEIVAGTTVWTADLDASSITITAPEGASLSDPTTRRVQFGDLDWVDLLPGEIIGFDLSFQGAVSGLAPSDIAFDAHSVTVNFASSFWGTGSSAIIDLQIQPIPIPATAWLFGSGLLGLIGITRRKKSS